MVNTELILKEACRIAEQNLAEQDYSRLNQTPDIVPSKQFERRMNKLIRRMKSGTYRKPSKAIRTLILVAAMIATLTISAVAVDPIREKVKNFIIDTFELYSLVEFEDDESTNGTLYSEYTWVPEGYEMERHTKRKLYEKIVYSNASGNLLVCNANQNDIYTTTINTEKIYFEEITINGINGIYYENKKFSQILWTSGEYNYSINYNGETLSKEDLIKMAESRKNVY